MKRLKLREEIKLIIMAVAFITLFTGLFIWGIERTEQINNGEMTVVSQSYMDR
jgi:hypothetical protein